MRNARNFKASLGNRGLYEQTAINERFFAGDQWHGAACPSDKPLVRHNIIKRIGDFKMSHLVSSKISVKYSAEGIPNTTASAAEIKSERKALSERNAAIFPPVQSENDIGLAISAINALKKRSCTA